MHIHKIAWMASLVCIGLFAIPNSPARANEGRPVYASQSQHDNEVATHKASRTAESRGSRQSKNHRSAKQATAKQNPGNSRATSKKNAANTGRSQNASQRAPQPNTSESESNANVTRRKAEQSFKAKSPSLASHGRSSDTHGQANGPGANTVAPPTNVGGMGPNRGAGRHEASAGGVGSLNNGNEGSR